jgi:hypothetical protein
MIELQALAVLDALERTRERILVRRAHRPSSAPALIAVTAVTVGWLARAAARRGAG